MCSFCSAFVTVGSEHEPIALSAQFVRQRVVTSDASWHLVFDTGTKRHNANLLISKNPEDQKAKMQDCGWEKL